jgi:hypothetical protein
LGSIVIAGAILLLAQCSGQRRRRVGWKNHGVSGEVKRVDALAEMKCGLVSQVDNMLGLKGEVAARKESECTMLVHL